MTREYREYAKSRIEYLLKISRLDERDKEALEAAIQALSQEPCEKCEVGNPCLYCEHEFGQKIEPCDDAISRDAVIGKVKELFSMGECYCDEHSIIGMINELPSVTQKPKTGH